MAIGQPTRLIKGLLLVVLIAIICMLLGQIVWLNQMGFGTLTLAILLGIVVGNTLYPKLSSNFEDGVIFAKSFILKLSIVLYGFNLTLAQIGQVGLSSVIADVIIVISTFSLSYLLGRRLFGLEPTTAILIGAGSSICGAAAVLATESVLKAGGDKVAIAVAVVVIFGTVAIGLYPAMYHFAVWSLTDSQWGIYIGSSVHEVAQVYAAGQAINPRVADIAVTTKMIRVMLLAPFLIFISFWLNRYPLLQSHEENSHVEQGQVELSHLKKCQLEKNHADENNNTNGNSVTCNTVNSNQNTKNKIIIPWFAVAFILVATFNSLALLPQPIVNSILTLDQLLLAMAMVAVGLTTHISAIKKAGIKPMLLGAIVMLWLVIAGGVLQVIF